ncbi:MAG: hypothetical protein FJ397_02145 [Verrucomicrobia bacterium]|nr:hypothetical protein [Verrucomicrobiota bacterium]
MGPVWAILQPRSRDESEVILQDEADERAAIEPERAAAFLHRGEDRRGGERPRHSLLSPPESARDLIQALGRNRRVGQRSPAFRTILTLTGSVEERVKAAVERKAAQIEMINDGDLRCEA